MSWMRRRDHNIFVNVGSLVLCGLLAGVVVAAAFFPGIAISGLAAQAAAEGFDQLPSELTVNTAPQMSQLYASDGKTHLATMYDEYRRDIDLEDVAPIMVEALIAAEDKKFYEHNGVDPEGILRAFVANANAGETTQGASTLTQQVVRMSLTYFADHPQDAVDATEQTTARKAREARLAIALEKERTKEEILELYLNLSFFGNGAYGIFAASQVYFGKAPSKLEAHEAALLAGLVKAPSQFNPGTEQGRELAEGRRDWVLDQMVETGALTAAEATEGKAIPLEVEPKRAPNDCVATVKNDWGFFCDYFVRWWLEQETFGATVYERERRLKGGGFRIITTLDVDAQAAAREHIKDQIDDDDPFALMVAAVEPGTGKVRAMAVNRRFALDDPDDPQNGPHSNPDLRRQDVRGTYPNTTNPLIAGGGDVTGYQAGSTFKLFTQLAALEEGIPLAYTINSPYRVTTRFPVSGAGSANCGGRWCPSNYSDQVAGVYDGWGAFGGSINTYYAQLIEQAGADNAVDVAQRLGIEFRAGSDATLAANAESWGAFTLGVSSTTPLDLAVAYATVSAEGVHCDPSPVEEILTMDGESLDVADPRCERVLDEDVALALIDAGRCTVGDQSYYGRCRGATARSVKGVVGKPVWGKTGTSDAYRTSTTIASTRQLTIAAMMADPDWAQNPLPTFSTVPRTVVERTLADAMDGVEAENWPRPGDNKLVFGDQVNIPGVACRSVSEAESILENAGFRVRIEDDRVDSDCAPGEAAGTSPSGRTIRGGHVTIEVSNGSGFNQDDGGDEGDGDNGGDNGGNGPGGPGNDGPGNG